MPQKLTAEIIHAAIEGFESQKRRIDAQIDELRQLLKGDRAAALIFRLGCADSAATGGVVRSPFSN